MNITPKPPPQPHQTSSPIKEESSQQSFFGRFFHFFFNNGQSQNTSQKAQDIFGKASKNNAAAMPPQPPKPKLAPTAAATKIQRVFRGWSSRQKVVLPNHILNFLKKHLCGGYDSEAILNITRGLCREINAMSLNPTAYKGKSIRLDKMAPHQHPFPVFTETSKYLKPNIIQLNFDCWIDMTPDGKRIDLVIIPPKNNTIGSGTYQTTHKAQRFEIPLVLKKAEKGLRNVAYKASTLKQQNIHDNKGMLKNDEERKTERNTILEGLTLQKTLLDNLKGVADVKLVGLPSIRTQSNASAKTDDRLEMEQEWYNGDFHSAIEKMAVPLDFGETPQMKKVTLRDLLSVCLDAAKTLAAIHQLGIVHHDVKPANTLLKINKQENVEGFLADFDLTTYIGSYGGHEPYAYWDLCAQSGWVTPFSDLYGLTMTLGEAVLPGFWKIRNDPVQYLSPDKREATKQSIFKDYEKLHPNGFKAAALTFALVTEVPR